MWLQWSSKKSWSILQVSYLKKVFGPSLPRRLYHMSPKQNPSSDPLTKNNFHHRKVSLPSELQEIAVNSLFRHHLTGSLLVSTRGSMGFPLPLVIQTKKKYQRCKFAPPLPGCFQKKLGVLHKKTSMQYLVKFASMQYLAPAKHSYKQVLLPVCLKQNLLNWSNLTSLLNQTPFFHPHNKLTLWTDESLSGWRALSDKEHTCQGLW